MPSSDDYRALSFWHESHPGPLEPRPGLVGQDEVDVAIVGAGYSGLWTAYYLKGLDPGLRVAIVEAEIAGFGASGRNGGWCLGTIPGVGGDVRDAAKRDGAVRLQRALFGAVDEVGSVAAREGIDCHYAKGGTLTVASVEAHRDRLETDLRSWRSLGFGAEDVRWLDARECRLRIGSERNLGGLFLAHCAALHPLRLARGLADAVERRGVRIHERSPVRSIEGAVVRTASGALRAARIVRATEGYTASLAGYERQLLPMHSNVIATEPLPESVWKEIGLAERETFADARRLVIYGQRTADDRIVFGARGRYFYGNRIHDRLAAAAPDFDVAHRALVELFPVLRGYRITHRWAGTLGIARDWRPSVGIDPRTGIGWVGGYAGEGVAASNLAGRTLAELLLGRRSERTDLPLVGRPFPRWELEPLRWLGVAAIRAVGASLDAAELRGLPTPRLRGALFDAFVHK